VDREGREIMCGAHFDKCGMQFSLGREGERKGGGGEGGNDERRRLSRVVATVEIQFAEL